MSSKGYDSSIAMSPFLLENKTCQLNVGFSLVSSFALLSSFDPKQPMLFPVFLALQAALIRLQHSIEEVSEQAYNKS